MLGKEKRRPSKRVFSSLFLLGGGPTVRFMKKASEPRNPSTGHDLAIRGGVPSGHGHLRKLGAPRGFRVPDARMGERIERFGGWGGMNLPAIGMDL